MNGRIYDPLLGRFLSADLHVPSPGDLQSFNRYSYVRNNPLSRIDPTGYIDEAAEEKRKEQERIEARARQYADELQKLTGAKVSVNWNGERWHVTLTQASPAKATTGAADLAKAESIDASGTSPAEASVENNTQTPTGTGTTNDEVSSSQSPSSSSGEKPPLAGMGQSPGLGIDEILSLSSFYRAGAGFVAGITAADLKSRLDGRFKVPGGRYPYRNTGLPGLRKISEAASKIAQEASSGLKELSKLGTNIAIVGIALDAAKIYVAEPGRATADATVSALGGMVGGVAFGLLGGVLGGPYGAAAGAYFGSQLGEQLTYTKMEGAATCLQRFDSPLVRPPQLTPFGVWF